MAPFEAPVRTVRLDELGSSLSKLRLCKPAADEQMSCSLRQHGQLTALTAFNDHSDALQLVDGFKRLRAAQNLGWSQLRVRIVPHDEATATAFIVALHEHRGLSELEEAWIVHSLCRTHKLSQGAVAKLITRHKSWVSRRLLLVEQLDMVVQSDVRFGLLAARSALAVALLPRGNQQQAAKLIIDRGMTTRQAESLVRHLRELDSNELRAQQMARWPERYARTKSNSGRARARSEVEQLLTDVATLMRLSVRVEVHLLETPVRVDGPEVVREALGNLAALLGTLEASIHRALALQDKADATLS